MKSIKIHQKKNLNILLPHHLYIPTNLFNGDICMTIFFENSFE